MIAHTAELSRGAVSSSMASSMPRVAIVYRLDRPGGVQSVAFALMRGLNREGIIPEVLWDTPPNPGLLARAGVQAYFHSIHFPIRSTRIDRLPNTLRRLAWIANSYPGDLLRADYDFFYVFHNGFLLPGSIPALRYLSGPPLLPQLDTPPKGAVGMAYRLIDWLYAKALRHKHPVFDYHRDNRYVINSNYTADLFLQAHGDLLPVIYPPVDTSRYNYSPGDLPARDTLTFFSRIVDYKRPEMLLELARSHSAFRCVIMGGVPAHRRDYFTALQDKARAMKLANVNFIANPDDERVRQVLAHTRYYVFPARNEHFGMTTVEAIAAGCIPYVHDSGGQREIVSDPRLRFDDDSFSERFRALTALDDDQLNELRQNLAGHIQQFSEDSFNRKMLAFLHQSQAERSVA